MSIAVRLPAPSRRLAGAVLALAVFGSTPAARARDAWAIDPAHTRIGFAIDATGYPRTEGSFRKFDGRIFVDFDHPGRSRVAFRVDAASVDLGSGSFEDYVRSEVFLNAARFPTISFASTSVTKIDEHRAHVVGDLTLLGQTRPLEVDVLVETTRVAGRAHLKVTATARIDRLAYGMNSGWPMVSGDVDLVVASEVVEQ